MLKQPFSKAARKLQVEWLLKCENISFLGKQNFDEGHKILLVSQIKKVTKTLDSSMILQKDNKKSLILPRQEYRFR